MNSRCNFWTTNLKSGSVEVVSSSLGTGGLRVEVNTGEPQDRLHCSRCSRIANTILLADIAVSYSVLAV